MAYRDQDNVLVVGGMTVLVPDLKAWIVGTLRDELREYVQFHEPRAFEAVTVDAGYPLRPADWPCISVIRLSETPGEQFIGQAIGEELAADSESGTINRGFEEEQIFEVRAWTEQASLRDELYQVAKASLIMRGVELELGQAGVRELQVSDGRDEQAFEADGRPAYMAPLHVRAVVLVALQGSADVLRHLIAKGNIT